MKIFSSEIISGTKKGYTGKPLVVNIELEGPL
jgi:hypothetical protein